MATKKILLSELETVSYGTYIPKGTTVAWRCNWGERYVEKWPENSRDVRFGFKVPPYVKSFTTNFNFKEEGTSMGNNTTVYFSALTQPLDILKTTTFAYPTESTLYYHPYRPIPTDSAGKIAHVYSNVQYNPNGYSIKCVGSDVDKGMTYYDYAYITAEYDEVGASGLIVSGSSIDDNIVVSWQSNFQDGATINIKNSGGAIVATKKVTTAKTVTFSPGTITSVGNYTVEVIASYRTLVETLTNTVALTKVVPTVVTLEPNNVNQDKNTDITVTWNSSNQHNFSLVANGKTYTGTTAKSLVIPKGTFTKLETVNLSLTISYISSWGEIRTATKSASFLLVGKPNSPSLEPKQYYTEAQPTFNWTSTDTYVQYRCEVYKDITSVFDSGDVVSSDTSCKCTTTLENNTQYTVKVKVKTQFGYWSDYTSNTFTTQFIVANKPSINVYISGSSVIINSNTVYSSTFSSCEIYRKTEYTDWIRIAFNLDNNFTYTDNFVGNETYYYKITSVSKSGGKNDSDIASAYVSINNFNFANVEDINNGLELVGNPSIAITQNRQVSTTLYSGCTAPVIEQGIQNYKSGNAGFTVRKATYDKLMSVINNSKILLYRDRRGEKFYCAITSNTSKKYDVGDVYNISFSFVEVPFEESDMYSGEGNLPVVFFNGKYKFDGTIKFSGEV